MFPDREYRLNWIKKYLELRSEAERGDATQVTIVTYQQVEELADHVDKFIPVSHGFLYRKYALNHYNHF